MIWGMNVRTEARVFTATGRLGVMMDGTHWAR